MISPDDDTDFGREIDARLKELDRPFPSLWHRHMTPNGIALWLMLAAVLMAMVVFPNRLFDGDVLAVTATLGGLAIWRYGWWFTHAVRSDIFARRRFPNMRRDADAVWHAGWRPRTFHIMMTTYYERPEITHRVIAGIVDQIRDTGCPFHIWVGTGSTYDEEIITDYLEANARDVDARVSFVRQTQPGKRMAIGIVLRAIRRSGAGHDDLIVFMDGDSILGEGTLRKCAGIFGADPDLEALTTDEEAICFGPGWMKRWLDMRFVQRRIAMQSHAVSHRVLTLTGRMSMFRGNHVLEPRFIRTVEADHLDHWLWGRFRFLSGDDKSTWFYLLSKRAKMTFVPDARVFTVEVVEGSGRERMVANLRRWSGNMLRNGSRALALGPRRVGFFIWWCILDQRLAMWTMLVSPTLAVYGSLIEPAFAISAVLWVLITRIIISLFMFRWSRRVDPTWPFILYINQVSNALVKVFIFFRLSQQSWANRGNQQSTLSDGWVRRLQFGISYFQTATVVTAFLWVMALWSGYAAFPI